MLINGVDIKCEIDCGSPYSIISMLEFQQKFPKLVISPSSVQLYGVDNYGLNTVGQVMVKVRYKGNDFNLRLIIVKFSKPATMLLGREWLNILEPQLKDTILNDTPPNEVKQISNSNFVEIYRHKFPWVFNADKSEAIQGFQARLVLMPNATPIFHKYYELPYSLCEKVEAKLAEMVKNKRLEPVNHSNWASPIWPIVKKNNEIRIVTDFRRTINPQLQMDHYPLPKLEDIWATLSNCSYFTKIDLTEAYLQLRVAPESQELLTVNTPWGLFRFNRLQYGVKVGPPVFQSVMDTLLARMKRVAKFLDDIVVGGENYDECLKITLEVLDRLNVHHVQVGLPKCLWLVTEIELLGYRINKTGIHPTDEKIEAIIHAKVPTNVSELRSYLGLVNFYARFLPNLSTHLRPLNQLLTKNQKFEWTTECQSALDFIKAKLCDKPVLEIYDPQKPMVVCSDASPFGVGSVLCHVVNNLEKPVMYASASLSPAQKRYSQLDREALGVVYSVKKFHKYLYGKHFTLVTDNHPLKTLLCKGIPVIASPRIQRWSVTLSAYNFTVEHRKATLLAAPDALSRLPLEQEQVKVINSYIEIMPDLPVTSSVVATATQEDPLLSQVHNFVLIGWPNSIEDKNLVPFFKIKEFLSLEEEVILFGDRAVIPSKLQKIVLNLLHKSHPGIVRMKLLARQNVWWPSLNSDIESISKSCEACQSLNFKPLSCESVSWPVTSSPWERVHVDHFYFDNNTFFLLVDTYSNWLDVCQVKSTSAESVIAKLSSHICTFGLLKEIVSDNGPPFDSAEFLDFCTANNILVSKSPPYHPKSNGTAERAVRTIKSALKKGIMDAKNVEKSYSLTNILSEFLLHYRNTPTTVKGKTPAELIFNYKPQIPLSLCKPQGQTFRKLVKLEPDCKVLVKFSKNHETKIGKIIRNVSPTTYLVNLDGNTKLVHVNQLKVTSLSMDSLQNKAPVLESSKLENSWVNKESCRRYVVTSPLRHLQPNLASSKISAPKQSCQNRPVTSVPSSTTLHPEVRRSGRIRKQRDRLDL
ncbi:uncharacterized protein [Bemisia tabaci]